MIINLTLLVQIGNFLLTYILVERLFFRRAVAVIKRRDGELDVLSDTVRKKMDSLGSMSIYAQEQWHHYQKSLERRAPSLLEPKLMLGDSPSSTAITLTQSEENSLVDEIVRSLSQKVLP